ncbi:hypothetical protein Ciccas_004111 [Cichlidogyrus casuarinus]|uniref:Uncharacterized protein n=1 Tax=Cichlidogyrus casuarinus TaxID=1844966 RepID=A0ABD2QER8_9PLAT
MFVHISTLRFIDSGFSRIRSGVASIDGSDLLVLSVLSSEPMLVLKFDDLLCPELWNSVIQGSLMKSNLIQHCLIFNRKSRKIHGYAPEGFTSSLEQNAVVLDLLEKNEDNDNYPDVVPFADLHFKIDETRKGGEMYAHTVDNPKNKKKESHPDLRAVFLLTAETVFMGTLANGNMAEAAIDLMQEMRKSIINQGM